jgi:hypothetical protein
VVVDPDGVYDPGLINAGWATVGSPREARPEVEAARMQRQIRRQQGALPWLAVAGSEVCFWEITNDRSVKRTREITNDMFR